MTFTTFWISPSFTNVPPYDICNTQQSLYSTGLNYISTSNSFPVSITFPSSPIQCSCSFKPSDQAVSANISIRALIVELWDYTSCSQKLTIRSCSNNDTVFCSLSVTSNVTSYVQLETNPSISFQTNSTRGHFLLEIEALTSSISGTIGSMTCNRDNVVQNCSISSSKILLASVANLKTSRHTYQTTNQPTTSVKQPSRQATSRKQQLFTNLTSTPDTPISSTNTIVDSAASETTQLLFLYPTAKNADLSSEAIGGIVAGFVVLVSLIIILMIGCAMRKRRKLSKPIATPAKMSGRTIIHLDPIDVTSCSSASGTVSTYHGLNLKTREASERAEQRHVEYQSIQRPYSTRLERTQIENCQREASYLEPINVTESSPNYENGISQNYQALNVNKMEAHRHKLSVANYQMLQPTHETNQIIPNNTAETHPHRSDGHSVEYGVPQVISNFQRSTLYESPGFDSTTESHPN